jgi:hypothetical protein
MNIKTIFKGLFRSKEIENNNFIFYKMRIYNNYNKEDMIIKNL